MSSNPQVAPRHYGTAPTHQHCVESLKCSLLSTVLPCSGQATSVWDPRAEEASLGFFNVTVGPAVHSSMHVVAMSIITKSTPMISAPKVRHKRANLSLEFAATVALQNLNQSATASVSSHAEREAATAAQACPQRTAWPIHSLAASTGCLASYTQTETTFPQKRE